MAPSEYIAAQTNGDKDNELYMVTVDERPYYPFLSVDPSKPDSIQLVASLVVQNGTTDSKDVTVSVDAAADSSTCEIVKISGGITNQLYRVSLPIKSTTCSTPTTSSKDTNDGGNINGNVLKVLVRLFGAEGMIDRNVENATYAALARQRLAPKYYGRFQNGRIEEWLEAAPLKVREMPLHSTAIAIQMGHLHANFVIPSHLIEYHNPNKPALWTDLHSWMAQALSANFANDQDAPRAKALQLPQIAKELHWLEHEVVPSQADIVFCHNDVLAANILKLSSSDDDNAASFDNNKNDNNNNSTARIQLIDFEYGGINYRGFDIANHFNEYAGGTDSGVPNYEWTPTRAQQEAFIQTYLQACKSKSSESSPESNGSKEMSIEAMLEEVQAFLLVNHLYWGLWAVNQAATEGCESFDYLLYATNRIQQYYKCKKEQTARA